MIIMDGLEHQRLAVRARGMRELGIVLIFASMVLALFLFLPVSPDQAAPAPIAIASTTAPDAFADLPIDAKAAIVYDLATGEVLYAKNADAQLPLASLTKLLTMYAAFSEFSSSTPITIPADVMGLSAPHAFLPGQMFTLSNLARLTLTGSLNDGAAAIAEAVAARENTSIHGALAGAAAALGLSQTYAINGNGLDVNTAVSGGYGSAYDLARLAGALVALAPDVASATTHRTVEASSVGGTSFTIKNTDPMVANIPGLLLSKTGYTDLADGNLALVFDVGIQHPVAVVVLGSTVTSRFTDGLKLVAATFAHFAHVKSL
ncbi:MAG TPA: serine hydrolase [Candidatus Paceibacterota bacterium]|nr:serine hydrolase [Candidatus Paceibacterota bacterium]